MAVSRRLRFEILRRDHYTCRYCGQAAPDVKLTVDHVLPDALGGSDEAENLVTACADCNSGKSSIAPDSPTVASVANDALRWATAIKMAASAQALRAEDRRAYVAAFDAAWCRWRMPHPHLPDGCPVSRPDSWLPTIARHFDLGLEIERLTELVDDVLPRSNVPDERMWPYFCGALRNLMTQRHELAADLIAQGFV